MRHFSDPFAKAVYDTISGGTAGVTWPELQELHQDEPDDRGQLRNTLAELRAAGAITSHSGKYWAVEEAAAVAAPAPNAKGESIYAVDHAASPAAAVIFHRITTKEKDMSGTRTEGTRHRVFEALKQAGTGSRESIAEATGLSLQAVANALAGLKFDGKLVLAVKGHRGQGAVYAPAHSGRSPGVDIDRAARKAAKAVKAAKAANPKKATTARAAAPVPAVSTPTRSAPAQFTGRPGEQGFRVGLFSDGTLSIIDADCEMQIDQNKTRALFNYLDTFQAMFTGASA